MAIILLIAIIIFTCSWYKNRYCYEWFDDFQKIRTQLAFTCSKSAIKTLEKSCEICSKLTIKTLERRQWRHFGFFIVYFEYISHLFPVFSIFDFEQVNISWVAIIAISSYVISIDFVILRKKDVSNIDNLNYYQTYLVTLKSYFCVGPKICKSFSFSKNNYFSLDLWININ